MFGLEEFGEFLFETLNVYNAEIQNTQGKRCALKIAIETRKKPSYSSNTTNS